MRSVVGALALSLVSLTWACDDEPIPEGDCAEADAHQDLDWLQAKIFTPTCAAFSPCHKGAASSAAGLSLEAGQTHANLVAVPSSRFPDRTLVIPGAPEQSYLLVALGEVSGPLSPKGTMPLNNPLLCEQKRAAIVRWIAAGAPE